MIELPLSVVGFGVGLLIGISLIAIGAICDLAKYRPKALQFELKNIKLESDVERFKGRNESLEWEVSFLTKRNEFLQKQDQKYLNLLKELSQHDRIR